MKQEEFRRQLAAITPDMPEHFVRHVDLVLEKIVAQEKAEAAQKGKTVSFMGRLISKRAMVVIITLMLMLTSLTAYAITRWNLFEQLYFILGDQIPEDASEWMQRNLHRQTINNVEITIQEAGYDGRTLFLQYSYRFLDIEEPLGVTAREMFGERLPERMNPDQYVDVKYDAF